MVGGTARLSESRRASYCQANGYTARTRAAAAPRRHRTAAGPAGTPRDGHRGQQNGLDGEDPVGRRAETAYQSPTHAV